MAKTVLTIAGFDPSSGAGITADLMVFAAHGLFGTACISALTVQNTLGVLRTHPVAIETLSSTLDCLHSDLPPLGIKIGMLANADIVAAVAAYLSRIRSRSPVLVVLDPVIKSSSGKDLLDLSGRRAMLRDLLPLVDWITPNRAELASLLDQNPSRIDDIAGAARDLQKQGTQLHVVVTGGDLDPPLDTLLQPSHSPKFVSRRHVQTTSTHGTGCAFSSALLCRLILGDQPLEAVQKAKAYVARAMETAKPIGSGHGPLHHLWPLYPRP